MSQPDPVLESCQCPNFYDVFFMFQSKVLSSCIFSQEYHKLLFEFSGTETSCESFCSASQEVDGRGRNHLSHGDSDHLCCWDNFMKSTDFMNHAVGDWRTEMYRFYRYVIDMSCFDDRGYPVTPGYPGESTTSALNMAFLCHRHGQFVDPVASGWKESMFLLQP